ncbi:hypothetical protein GCM10022234_01980 [Aeromicrobium panaciterrae]|uniref:hypothetical protein n=1 Tax=Aeromicrobium panaciterrae TaxID=363861 RepID=UPI0031E21DA7
MFREKHAPNASTDAMHGQVLPLRMAGLWAAWTEDGDIDEAVWDAGSVYALDGESLQVLLDDVDMTRTACRLPPPDVDLVRALALAWSEAALSRYVRLTCTDPLTGLATAQHLQTQVVGLVHTRTSDAWALVVVEVASKMSLLGAAPVPPVMLELINLSDVADLMARELSADVTAARLTSRRCAALVPQAEASGLATRMDRRIGNRAGENRIWIERLPDEPAQAAALIDELSR